MVRRKKEKEERRGKRNGVVGKGMGLEEMAASGSGAQSSDTRRPLSLAPAFGVIGLCQLIGRMKNGIREGKLAALTQEAFRCTLTLHLVLGNP